MESLVFLTFGTGFGAGLILDGRLYRGATNLAGEIGHVRLADTGPIGYQKAGSCEGFCSGGGIVGAARMQGLTNIANAKAVFDLAQQGNDTCQAIIHQTGEKLGKVLAMLIDLLNPQAIILGGIYPRQQKVLDPYLHKSLEREALPQAYQSCRILPAALGDLIGDYSALAASFSKSQPKKKEE